MKFSTLRQSEEMARKKVSKSSFEWLQAGAENGFTREKNFIDLNKIKIIPKFLNKITNANIASNFFGTKLNSPLLLAPIGHQTQWHKDGELEMAKGLELSKTLGFFSSQGRFSLREIRQKNKKNLLAWSILPFGNKEWILKQIENAIKFNCLAFCLVIDSNVRSHRYQDLEVSYDARKHGRMGDNHSFPPDISYALKYDWKIISWIKKKTKLPIIVKGILTWHDAKLAIDNGCDCIWISNHAGRMFNSGISTIEALNEISSKLKRKKVKIIIDSGIRSGSDIIKSLCLGADYVAIGKPALCGLINEGRLGVKNTFSILESELKTAMINGGFKNLSKMKKNRVRADL